MLLWPGMPACGLSLGSGLLYHLRLGSEGKGPNREPTMTSLGLSWQPGGALATVFIREVATGVCLGPGHQITMLWKQP